MVGLADGGGRCASLARTCGVQKFPAGTADGNPGPVPAHIWGAHIDRATVQNVQIAGFIDFRELWNKLDSVRKIEPKVPTHEITFILFK